MCPTHPLAPTQRHTRRAVLGGVVAGLGLAACQTQQALEVPSPPPPVAAVQNDDIDLYALAAPTAAEMSVDQLAQYLAAPGWDEAGRMQALFRWVTDRIRYDVTGFRSGDYGDLSPEAVLQRRSAVCDGYAGLFSAVGRRLGLQVAIIPGLAKGVTADDTWATLTENHAWNAVQIEGQWLLLDATWGAGYLNERGQYEHQFRPFYFRTPPEDLIWTHFPSEQRWQLLPHPMARSVFLARPRLYPAAFALNVRPYSHWQSQLTAPALLQIAAPAGVQIVAAIQQSGSRQQIPATRSTPELVSLLVPATLSGPARLTLFAGPANGTKLQSAIRYDII